MISKKEINHQILVDLFNKIEKYSDKERLKDMLEKRGRHCISSNYIKKAKDAAKGAKDTNEFLERLRKTLPMLKKEGETIYMIYPRCYCHKVKGFKGNIPPAYCYCSVGWVKELFEQGLKRSVTVTLETSVLRGDDTCRLRVVL